MAIGIVTGKTPQTAWRRAIGVAICLSAIGLLPAGVQAQATNSPSKKMGAETRVKESVTPQIQEVDLRPVHRGVTYGGALHDAVKSNHPFQMVNPMAPAQYGNGEENLVKDPITKKARGVALFSIRW